jgi:hypothetical protein
MWAKTQAFDIFSTPLISHYPLPLNIQIFTSNWQLCRLSMEKNAFNKPKSNLYKRGRLLYLVALPWLVGSSFWWKISKTVEAGEYWMINRESGFLPVVWFGSSPTPFLSTICKLSLFLSLPLYRRSSLLPGEGDMRWGRSQNHTRSSINHSILSGCLTQPRNR